MTIIDILPVIGGLALFLYGMSLMGTGLESVAGSKLEALLEKLTNNLFKSVLFGAVATAIVQSSSATTVMVVGFVNAGIMKLPQVVGVILGANIGTTVTAWMLTLADITNTGLFFTLVKPANLAYILVAIGAVMHYSKTTKRRDIGDVLIGLGVLFIGMKMMESGLSPLRESAAFKEMFVSFENPLLGIAVGALVTAAIQSSSASVGILQALAASGLVPFSAAVPIIMGQNIGTCVTVMIASVGANKNAKKAGLIHLYFNLIGTAVFTVLLYAVQYSIGLPFWDNLMTRTSISIFHTFFNVINVLWMLPFTGLLLKLVNATIKNDEVEDVQSRLALLDERLLEVPAVALSQCMKVLNNMATSVSANLDRSVSLFSKLDPKVIEQINDDERFVDKADSRVSSYVVSVTSSPLSDEDNNKAADILNVLTDIERIGDHAVNIADIAKNSKQNDLSFSENADKELELLHAAVREIIDMSFDAFFNDDEQKAFSVEPLEETIDDMKERLRGNHIERLSAGICTVEGGIAFLELLSDFERISDHCSNIAIVVMRSKWKGSGWFDGHKYQRQVHKAEDPRYVALVESYRAKYLDSIGPAIS